jgi:flagellar biosynthesis/type III secretory pathway chaperone
MSYRTWEDLEDDEVEDASKVPTLSQIVPDDLSSLMETHPRLVELKNQRDMLERRMADLSGGISEPSSLRQIASDVPTMAERRAEYARWEQRHETTTVSMQLARREMDDIDRRWSAMREHLNKVRKTKVQNAAARSVRRKFDEPTPRNLDDMDRQRSVMQSQKIDTRKAKESETIARLVRKKGAEPALRSMDRENVINRAEQNGLRDQRMSKAPPFECNPKSGIDAKSNAGVKRSEVNLDRPSKAPTREGLSIKSIELRRPVKARLVIKTAAKPDRVEDRFERVREAASTARLHQQRAARSTSDLRVLDDKLEKARETARAARHEMSLSDDMSGKRPESLYAGLDDRSAPKAKQRDPKFDVDHLYERRKKKKEKTIEEPTRRKKSLMEQLDDRRKTALEKRRDKKKQESKRR